VSNTSRTTAYQRHVEWRAAGWFLAAAVPATFLVATRVSGFNPHLIELALGALLIATLLPGKADKPLMPPVPSYVVAGLVNGTIGMFVGATGTLVGRLFLQPGWARQTTIGTLAFTQMLGHGLRVIAYGWIGLSAFADPQRLIPLCIAVILGTWAGKTLNDRVSHAWFERLFMAVLVILSIKLVWDGASGLLAGSA